MSINLIVCNKRKAFVYESRAKKDWIASLRSQ